MTNKTVKKTKKGKIVKNTHQKGPFAGEYNYTLFDGNGNFVKNISNRNLHELNACLIALN